METLNWQKQEVPGQPGIYSEWFIKARTDYTIDTYKGREQLWYTISKSMSFGNQPSYTAWFTRLQIVAESLGTGFTKSEDAKEFCQQHFEKILREKLYNVQPVNQTI